MAEEIRESVLHEVFAEVMYEFTTALKVELDPLAARHFGDIYHRTIEEAVHKNGLDWYEKDGRAYALNRARQFARRLNKLSGEVGAEELEDELWELTNRTREALRRRDAKEAGLPEGDETSDDTIRAAEDICPKHRRVF